MNDDLNPIQQHLALLGKEVRDQVTMFKGIATNVSFDLYGGIYALVTPFAGREFDPTWFAINRLVVVGKNIIPAPEYIRDYIDQALKDATEKPVLKD